MTTTNSYLTTVTGVTGASGDLVESKFQWPTNRAGNLKNFRAFVAINTATVSGTIRVRVNGVTQASLAIPAATTGVFSFADIVPVVDTDLVSMFLESSSLVDSNLTAVLTHDFI